MQNGTVKEPFLNRGIAFESAGWRACKFTTILLTQIMRQEVRTNPAHPVLLNSAAIRCYRHARLTRRRPVLLHVVGWLHAARESTPW